MNTTRRNRTMGSTGTRIGDEITSTCPKPGGLLPLLRRSRCRRVVERKEDRSHREVGGVGHCRDRRKTMSPIYALLRQKNVLLGCVRRIEKAERHPRHPLDDECRRDRGSGTDQNSSAVRPPESRAAPTGYAICHGSCGVLGGAHFRNTRAKCTARCRCGHRRRSRQSERTLVGRSEPDRRPSQR